MVHITANRASIMGYPLTYAYICKGLHALMQYAKSYIGVEEKG